jgi:hypothetical protein
MSRFGGAIVNTNGKTLVGHVHDQILTHYGQTNQSNIVL